MTTALAQQDLFRLRPPPHPKLHYSFATALNLDADGSPLRYSTAMKGPNASHWRIAEAEEFDRLFSSGTMHPILPTAQPLDRRKDTTYYNPQCKEKSTPDGGKTFRIRGTVGGDRLKYPGNVSAFTADMDVVKVLLHSVVSDNAKWLTADIKDYYLGTPLSRPEYMRIPLSLIPACIIDKHALQPFIYNDRILFEINKGMYGLPQAGLLAQQRLFSHLATQGYHQCPNVPCLFRHNTRRIAFSLVVDDFGVKFHDQADADHLIATLRSLYDLKVDWTGQQYLGMTITFDATAKSVALSMPKYIDKVIQRFCPNISRGAASPMVYVPPTYGAHQQTATIDTGDPLSAADRVTLQEIVGCMLYYARAIDSTMLTAVNHLSSSQAHPTATTLANAQRLLAYAAAYPNNRLVYTACDMILYIQSDASYLSRPKARSVAGGYLFLGNANQPTHINGAIHTLSNVIDVVVASAFEAEYGAAFINAKVGEWIRTILHVLGYPQPPTLILCDNECAVGMANNTVKAKRSKAIDMRFHWLRDRVHQRHFVIAWQTGANNLADFFTKALPMQRHQALMPYIVHTPLDLANNVHNKRMTRAQAWKNSSRTVI